MTFSSVKLLRLTRAALIPACMAVAPSTATLHITSAIALQIGWEAIVVNVRVFMHVTKTHNFSRWTFVFQHAFCSLTKDQLWMSLRTNRISPLPARHRTLISLCNGIWASPLIPFTMGSSTRFMSLQKWMGRPSTAALRVLSVLSGCVMSLALMNLLVGWWVDHLESLEFFLNAF